MSARATKGSTACAGGCARPSPVAPGAFPGRGPGPGAGRRHEPSVRSTSPQADEPVRRRSDLHVRGWTFFPERRRPGSRSGSAALARTGAARRPRTDVARSMEDPRAAAVSGFELTADLSEWGGRRREHDAAVGRDQRRRPALRARAGAIGVGRRPRQPSRSCRRPRRAPPTAASDRRPHGLVVTHQLNLGGAQLYLLDLLRELLERGGFAPTVVSAMDGPLRAELEELGIPVHVTEPPPDGRPRLPPRPGRGAGRLGAPRAIRARLRQHRHRPVLPGGRGGRRSSASPRSGRSTRASRRRSSGRTRPRGARARRSRLWRAPPRSSRPRRPSGSTSRCLLPSAG